MEWLNLHVSILDAPEFLGSEPTHRAAWLCLLRYCIGQENGGVIKDCREWKDRKWQQVVRVTLREVTDDSELWTWHEDDLHIFAYPADKEAEVQHLRGIGSSTSPKKTAASRTNGRLGGRPKKPKGTEHETQHDGFLETHEEPEKPNNKPIERKGKEEEGNRNGKEHTAASGGECVFPSSNWPNLIVEAYPRREGVSTALSIVAKQIADGEENPESILSGTRAHAAAIAQLPSGPLNRYVKSAETFFRGKHWKDDPQTVLRHPVTNGATPPATNFESGGRQPSRTLNL